MYRTLCALVVAVLMVGSTDAFASVTRESVVVRTHDVDPNSTRGARMLMRRIDRAADLVCGKTFARQYLTARRNFRRCHELVVARVVDQIDTPELRRLHGLRPHI